jgi:flagellar basal-body rod modification protein FlgD
MSGSISSTTPASASASASSSGTAAQAQTNALQSLTSNFSSFLNLLMTQLQNQDPSSPMDTDQFTSELVQFSGVEQQITTNNSLTQLIQATQGSEVIQGTDLVGKSVTVTSPQMPLQNGTGSLSFTTPTSEPVSISIKNASGTDVRDVSLTSNAGSNSWTWDGTDNNGNQLADGAYTVTVTNTSGGTGTAIPFTVSGTATGVSTSNGTVSLQLGAVSVGFGNVQQVGSN